jgi:succinoglycan biosynthesis protein ExoA
MPTVTIVVPCRNEVQYIDSFLQNAIAQESLLTRPEIVVSDGMSDDGTREILARWAGRYQEIRVLDNHSRTVSPGLNAAIREARGEVIVRMDVHTRFASDYVSQCVAVLQESGAQNVGGAARTEAVGRLARAIAAAYASPFAVGSAHFHFPEYEGPVDTITYGCWWRQDLLRWGLFDETLDRNQDDELNFRIRRDSGTIWQSARIRSWYRPRAQLSALFRQYYQYGRWKPVVIRKHRALASWRHSIPPLAVVGLVVAAVTFLGCPWCRPFSAVALGAYPLFLLIGTARAATRHGWDLLPILPAAFACFHFGYGLGFLVGMARAGLPPRHAAKLTR